MSTCKGCGAEIIWAKTVNGKNIPLDAKPEKRFTIEERQSIEDETEEITRLSQVRVAHMHDTYMPHHATCPDVGMFRRQS